MTIRLTGGAITIRGAVRMLHSSFTFVTIDDTIRYRADTTLIRVDKRTM